MKNREEIKYLLERYISGKAGEEEYDRLFKILGQDYDTDEWETLIGQMAEQHPADPLYERGRWEPMIVAILGQEARQAAKRSGKWPQWFTLPRAAAAVILLLAIGAWLGARHWRSSASSTFTKTENLENDIAPGGNKATLTLANGKTVLLDSMSKGTVALQGGTKVLKLASGQLAYNNINEKSAKEVFNTLSTPSGGQYAVILPDGSKVWLNATSSIRFPTAFTGSERHVYIRGEAYFEVADNEKKPFVISVNDLKIKVLGTHFNIMAYDNEPTIQTTLLEGAVEITRDKAVTILKPGQQARVDSSGRMSVMKHVDVGEAVAWKKGLFQFTDASIADIMRQIARWYNVEIIYEDGIPPGHITGRIPRNTNLCKVLDMMQLSGVHFRIQGKKVIVLPI